MKLTNSCKATRDTLFHSIPVEKRSDQKDETYDKTKEKPVQELRECLFGVRDSWESATDYPSSRGGVRPMLPLLH